MRCDIFGKTVTLFARAIHCLARIGHDIYVEPLKEGLSLRTVNTSRSAYAYIIFKPSFFQSYKDGIPDDKSSSEKGLKCKLSVRSFLTVFRSVNTIDRTVYRCLITMTTNDSGQQFMTFQMTCVHGILKTYNLSYQECESLEAEFTKDLSPNLITVQSQTLVQVVTSFQNCSEEITLTVCPENVAVSNYIDDDEDLGKVIKTKIELDAEEFDKYQIGVDTEITFCLKELKAIVNFADLIDDMNVDIHFESGGKPIVFSLVSDPTFEANFVLATFVDVQGSQASQQKNKQKKGPQKASTGKEGQKASKTQDVDENEFGLDEDEDWVNEIIAAEEQQSQSMQVEKASQSAQSVQKTSTSNNRGKHPDFKDSFQSKAALSKKTSTSTHAREVDTSSKAEKQSVSSQTRKGSVSSQARNASTSSQAKNASTSSQAKNASTSSQARNASTSSQARNAGTSSQAKNASTSSQARNASTSSQARNASTSSQARNASTSSQARNASTSSQARNASTSSQARNASTSSQARNASTSSLRQRTDQSTKHTQIGPHSAPGNLAREEISGRMSTDSEISPGIYETVR